MIPRWAAYNCCVTSSIIQVVLRRPAGSGKRCFWFLRMTQLNGNRGPRTDGECKIKTSFIRLVKTGPDAADSSWICTTQEDLKKMIADEHGSPHAQIEIFIFFFFLEGLLGGQVLFIIACPLTRLSLGKMAQLFLRRCVFAGATEVLQHQ